MDKMIWQNKEYELTINNMEMARLIEATENSVSMIEAYTNEMNVVVKALGDETVETILGTADVETVDLGTLVLLYNAVIDGYEKRIVDMRNKKDEKSFAAPSFKNISKLAEDVRIIQSVDNNNVSK